MKNIFTNKKQYFAQLPVSLLGVDYSYQKPLTMPFARKLAKEFDPMGVGQIHVSKRMDNTYWIFDGQHRWNAHKIRSMDVIDCIVYEGLTIEEEARGYVFYNDTMKQTQLQKFKAEMLAEVPSAVKLNNAVLSAGLSVNYNGDGAPINAIGAVKSIFNKKGEKKVRQVLGILKSSYGINRQVYQAFILNGMSDFLEEYQSNVNFDKAWLVRNLKRQGIEKLMVESGAFNSIKKSTKKEATTMALVELYNHNKRKDNRL